MHACMQTYINTHMNTCITQNISIMSPKFDGAQQQGGSRYSRIYTFLNLNPNTETLNLCP